VQVEFWFNGQRRSLSVIPDVPAQEYLGEIHGRRGTCGDGSCLQCAILLGGRVVTACSLPAYRLDGAEIVDLDGMHGDTLHHDIMRAFDKIGISRCRAALPGLVFLAYQLLSDNPLPGDEDLHEFSRHLTTRCVSREEFERAVRLAGRVHKRKLHEQSR
tara:strand:+ start:571 stop:1047 length:477 start_codon:yes stop_codon:yes gene_type:complete